MADLIDTVISRWRIAWTVGLFLNLLCMCPVKTASFSFETFDTLDKLSNGKVNINFAGINDYESINDWLVSLASEFPFVRLHDIGKTVENRHLIIIEIDKTVVLDQAHPDTTEVNATAAPVVFLDAGTHAREQLTVSVALAVIRKLCVTIRDDRNSSLAKIRWFIFPLVNPDGYEYVRTSTKGKMWRKNRSHPDPNCVGVDINRNWDYQWGMNPAERSPSMNKSSSSFSLSWLYDSVLNPKHTIRQLSLLNPCAELFAGPHPFSEVESSSLAKFIDNIRSNPANKLQAYVSLHSMHKDQVLMFPYGYTSKRSPDHDALRMLAEKMSNAMFAITGRRYRYGSVSDIMYQTTGVQVDWLYAVAHIKRSFVLELRDDFRKPAALLIPKAFDEVWTAVDVLMQDIVK